MHFHILSADIKDTVYVRFEECGCIIVRHSFHFTLVKHEGGLDQRFTPYPVEQE